MYCTKVEACLTQLGVCKEHPNPRTSKMRGFTVYHHHLYRASIYALMTVVGNDGFIHAMQALPQIVKIQWR